jgi:hypothetical protein
MTRRPVGESSKILIKWGRSPQTSVREQVLLSRSEDGFGECRARGHTEILKTGSRIPMYFVAAALAVLSGLFYAASHHEIGSLGVEMCRYGSTFCDNPVYVLTGAGLAAVWGTFVSIR